VAAHERLGILGWAKDDAQHIAAFEAAKSPAVPA